MAAMTAAQAKAIAERYQKAVELVNDGRAYRLYGGHEGDYIVVNGNGQAYLVNVISGECTCPDSRYRCSRLDILCKHALVALIVHERAQKGAGGASQPPAEPHGKDGFPAAWRQECGQATEHGQLCPGHTWREINRVRSDAEALAKARELLDHLL